MGAGIDYGRGITNIDHETGIRYGVIGHYEVYQAWEDSAEADYGTPSCGFCGNDATERVGDDITEVDDFGARWHRYEYRCTYEECAMLLTTDEVVWPDTPIAWTYSDTEYDAQQGGDDTDIFVTRSPYYTLCRFCSPCAPGAGYLTSQDEDGIKAYCFGPEWFEDGKVPYTVYRVSDDSIVATATEE